LIWVSGKAAGVYAIGSILSVPVLQPDSPKGVSYWYNPIEGLQTRARALVKYERKLLENPLLKEYLQWDFELKNLSIFRRPMGTNFRVTPQEWEALSKWLE
jgi:hypothetical protein